MKLKHGLVTFAVLAWATGAQAKDYCMEEVELYLSQNLGGKNYQIQNVERGKYGGSGQEYFYIWVRTNLCKGRFVFDFEPGSNFDCKMQQYGTRTQFLSRVFTTGDCDAVLAEDYYPHVRFED